MNTLDIIIPVLALILMGSFVYSVWNFMHKDMQRAMLDEEPSFHCYGVFGGSHQGPFIKVTLRADHLHIRNFFQELRLPYTEISKISEERYVVNRYLRITTIPGISDPDIWLGHPDRRAIAEILRERLEVARFDGASP